MKKKKESLSKKLKKLNEELKLEKEKTREHYNRLVYLQADFENYRKRVENEILERSQIEKQRIITNLLNVIDELELALNSGERVKNKKALLEGIQMTLKKMYSTLEKEGLKKIDAVGKTFDPKLHEVVTEVPTKEHREGIIIEDIRSGFMFKDRIIRPSMVKIATNIGDEP